MLERTAGCLESGSLRRLLPASKKAMNSRRALHASFWTHGASDQEMSPSWAAMVPIATPAEQRGRRGLQQQRLATMGHTGMLFDLLYPAGTLNFSPQYLGGGMHRAGGRLARNGLEKLGYRQYTSFAPNNSSNTAGSLLEAAILEDGTGVKRKNMALLYEKLDITKDLDFEEAWRRYSLLEDGEKSSALQLQLMHYLSTSERLVDAERTIQLFEALEQEHRKHISYRRTIQACLKMRNLADAMTLYATALETLKYPAGAEELLAYLVKNSSWSRAFSVWKDLNVIRAQIPLLNYNIFVVLDQDPTIGSQAIELAEYVNRRSGNTSPDAASDDSADFLYFASRVVERALLSTQTFNPSRFTSLLAILQDWNLVTRRLFDQVASMLIGLNETKLAIRSYRSLRASKDMLFSGSTLHMLLKICCEYHSILGMQQILDDFFRMHSRPTMIAYRMCMSEFAAQGDAQTVHALFDQLMEKYRGKLSASEFSPVLQVHAKRGEVQEVITWFNQMQDVHGIWPDLRCWNILISAYGKVHDVDSAYACFEQLLNDDTLLPDDYTIGTLMGICTTRGDIDRVVGLYMFAQERKIVNSAAMLDCLVLSHVQAGDLQKAERICEDALDMKIKGSRKRMWNYLLTAHALNRDLAGVNRLFRRMSEAGVESDQYTYSALMQLLCMINQPNRAHDILTDVMPPAGIQATNFHYAVLMGGYLTTMELSKIFVLQRRMAVHSVKASASTKLMALKATVAEEERLLENGTAQEKLDRALEIFGEVVASMDPQDISNTARKGIGRLPLDIAYSTVFNRYIIYVLGKHAEFSAANDLYEAYKKFLPASQQPPLAMMHSIMGVKVMEGDHETVQKCWEASLKLAKELGKPIEAELGNFPEDHFIEPERQLITPARQLDLARHLGIYMQSLHTQRKTDDMIATVDGLLSDGFALDNHNWNSYITYLAIRHKYQLGFRLCEKYLMDRWTGWARIRWTLPERNRLSVGLRAKKKLPIHFRPKYITILHLARGYLELRSRAAESRHDEAVLTDLEVECPRVVMAITTMQRVDDYLERTVLKEY